MSRQDTVTFIDLFAGIGGFHLALHNNGAKCVFASEIDSQARQTYEANFKKLSPDIFNDELFNKDIKTQDASKIPDFDILCAGFPCQPFSNAGFKKGFEDTRGTLFFDIARIIKEKRPKAFILENVRGLKNHNNGKTLARMGEVIDKLGYTLQYQVLYAKDFGVPQLRPRLIMVGFKSINQSIRFRFPEPSPLKYTMSDVFEGKCDRDIGFTLRVGGKSSPINDRRNWDGYIVDGQVRRIEPIHALKMQGFPSDFKLPVSKTQAMKQLGNSVAVPVIQAVSLNVINSL